MRAQSPSSPADVIGVGIAFALGGVYFILIALDLLPLPGETNSPPVIVACAGAAFLFAGLTCFVRAKASMTDQQSHVSAGAPPWIMLSYRTLSIGAAGALAIIGTWIAIGSGPRSFVTPLGEMTTTGELIGRMVFGLGAVIVWIVVIALALGTVRKLFDRADG
jgi:hypothetical protein